MKRRKALGVIAATSALIALPTVACACPPPKYKVGQLVELSNGVRLYVVKRRVKDDQNHYDLATEKNGQSVTSKFEKELRAVK